MPSIEEKMRKLHTIMAISRKCGVDVNPDELKGKDYDSVIAFMEGKIRKQSNPYNPESRIALKDLDHTSKIAKPKLS